MRDWTKKIRKSQKDSRQKMSYKTVQRKTRRKIID